MPICSAFLCAGFSIDGDLRHAGYIMDWPPEDRHSCFLHGMQQGASRCRFPARFGSCGADGSSSVTISSDQREPLFDVHPVTGASIEIFFADRTLETFGRRGAGWYWLGRERGYAADGPAIGPFSSAYLACRHALREMHLPHNSGAGSLSADHMRQGAAEQIASEPARAAARTAVTPLGKPSGDQLLGSERPET